MRFTSVLLLVFAVAGCATTSHGTAGRNLSFNCSGPGKGWDECTQQADKQCGAKGYDIVARNVDSVSGASGTSEMKRELIVACK